MTCTQAAGRFIRPSQANIRQGGVMRGEHIVTLRDNNRIRMTAAVARRSSTEHAKLAKRSIHNVT